jgi:hypothetical protein
MAGERQVATWPATPTAALSVNTAVPADWRLAAVDRQGLVIGSYNAAGLTTLRPLTIADKPAPERPPVPDHGVVVTGEAGLARTDWTGFTVVCPWLAADSEKAAARALAQRLGLGLAWDNVGGSQILIGSADNQLIADLGQLRAAVSTDWPGAGKGVVASFDSTELTEAPMILLAGSDPAGTLQAVAYYTEDFLPKQAKPPTGFTLWASRPDRKLFPYSRPMPLPDGRTIPSAKGQPEPMPADAPIRLQAARGEYEPAQVGLTAFSELRDVVLTVDPLVNDTTGEALTTKKSLTTARKRLEPVSVRWVDFFPLDRENGWAGYPDPLLYQPERTIPVGETRALWLTVFVPETAPAGRYHSQVTATANGVSQSIPLSVEVWDFTLPLDGLAGEPYMALDRFPKISGSTLSERGIQSLISNLVEHGMRVIHLGPAQSVRWHFSAKGEFKGKEMPWLLVSDDGCVAMDASLLGDIVSWCDKAGAPFKLDYMVYAKTVLEGFGDFRRALPKRFAGQPERTGNTDQSYYAEEMLGLYKRWLVQQGWEDRFVLKLADEPPGFLYWYENCTQAARRVGLRCMTAFNAVDWAEAEPHLGEVAIWQPLYMLYQPEPFAKARAAGAKLSWYNCGPPPRITNAATASELRGYLWQAAKADLDLVAWWGIQCWGYSDGDGDLWRNKYSHWNSVIYPAHPTRQPFLQDGKIWRDTSPLDSIRWEHIRDGMEDAWYANELRRRIAAARAKGQVALADQAQATLDAIWQDLIPTLNDYRPPYEQMMACRAKLAAAILTLPPGKTK